MTEDVFYTDNARGEIWYIPSIASKQSSDETDDPTLKTLRQALEFFQPNVLIVGNNTVNSAVIVAWCHAVGDAKKLQIIRRGVDTRAIDKTTAQKYNVIVDNLPGLNSPYDEQNSTPNFVLFSPSGDPNHSINILFGGNGAIASLFCPYSCRRYSTKRCGF